MRAVQGAQPAQPAHNLRDIGAEDTPVVMALVDHHEPQSTEELGPPGMAGEQRAMQHVGVGEDHLRMVASPVPGLARAVPVVGGDAEPGDIQRQQSGHLVVRQRLGG